MTTGAINFKKYGIETIKDLFEFCEKIEYGWLDKKYLNRNSLMEMLQ